MTSSGETPLFHWHFSALDRHDSKFSTRALFLLFIFFCITISTIALFLYTHWVCRPRRVSNTATVAGSTAVVSQASLGLDSEAIESIPVILVSVDGEDGVNESECSICLSIYEDKEKVKVLPQCNHAFHSECVDKWLRSQSSCPLCRASLVQVETAHGKSTV